VLFLACNAGGQEFLQSLPKQVNCRNTHYERPSKDRFEEFSEMHCGQEVGQLW